MAPESPDCLLVTGIEGDGRVTRGLTLLVLERRVPRLLSGEWPSSA